MNFLIKKIKRRLVYEWCDRRNLPFRLSCKINRWIISHSRNPRPSSYPYVSGDTFRAISQHIYDDYSTINPESILSGEIVFVDIHKIEEFFKLIHPNINNQYKLITHNGDISVSKYLSGFIDEKIIHWYGQNIDVIHPKISVIPHGIDNMHWYNAGIISNIKKNQQIKLNKKSRILFGFSVNTNPKVRQPVFDILLKTPMAEKITGWPSQPEYLPILNSYKFIAAPPGNGIDAPREWQAMLLRVVPILKNSIVTSHFKKIGLPVLLVDDWSELLAYDEEKLNNIYEEMFPKFNSTALYFDYWKNLINEKIIEHS